MKNSMYALFVSSLFLWLCETAAGGFLLIVTTNTDNGSTGTLRTVVQSAASSDTIIFATSLSGSTILLTNGQILLANSLTIDASALTGGIMINGNANSRIFQVNPGNTVLLNSLTITNGADNVFELNSGGGGILNYGILTLTNCILSGNSSVGDYGGGGGIYNTNTLTLDQCTLSRNSANDLGGGGGGGIYNSGTLTLNGCILSGNLVPTADGTGGGGIYNPSGILTLNDCVLSENSGTDTSDTGMGGGGGIYNNSTLVLNRCTLSGNSFHDGSGGGGIYNNGALTLNQCTLSGNLSTQSLFGGGGIYFYAGTLTLNECTLSGNSASTSFGGGGGIYSRTGTLMLNQCTLSGNSGSGTSQSGGGGIYNASSTLTLNQCTLSGNSAPSTGPNGGGGGLYNGGLAAITNSIVAGNNTVLLASGDIYNRSSLTYGGTNIIDLEFNNSFGGTVTGTAPLTSSPNLAPLGNFGGPTQTMPPLPGSPAIDAGSDSAAAAFATDQRGPGYPRLVGLAVDIGAVEGVYNPAGPGILHALPMLGNGSASFTFTNSTDMSFTVLATTNLLLPLNSWVNLGPTVESPAGSGQYQFTDSQAPNYPQRFYSVRWP